MTSQLVLDGFAVGVVDHCGKVEHEEADEGSHGQSPVHAVFNPLGGDGEGQVEHFIVVIQIVTILYFFCDKFLSRNKSNDFIPLGAAVDFFHDIGPGSPRKVLEHFMLREEQSLAIIVDFDLNAQQIILQQGDILLHIATLHVFTYSLLKSFHWGLRL